MRHGTRIKFSTNRRMSVYSYSLQIEKYRENILKVINKHQTTIIKGPTGCGKSTYVPILFKDKRIAIIEPRRIAVLSIYNILAPHIQNLGYKMRFNKKTNKDTKSIIYTDGSFLNDIMDSLDYEYIIVDEVHELSVRTDLLLGILRKDYKGKLILMSATLDTARLEKYFNARVYEIPGQSHPVEIKYLAKPTADYIAESYLTIRNILKTRAPEDKKDILVFLPGEEDINELAQICKKSIPSITVYKVYSAMSDKEQARVNESNPLTRVILSTNICETSLTIPNVKYVIDTGLCKMKILDGISYFGIHVISRESATQRTGRCNRLGPGVCYRLYTEFEHLPSSKPDITRSDLSSTILSLSRLGRNFFNFEFLNYPPINNCILAVEFLLSKGLIELLFHKNKLLPYNSLDELLEVAADGFVDYSQVIKCMDVKITKYGKRVAIHPFDPILGHFYEQCIGNELGYQAALLLSLISQENFNFMTAQTKDSPDIMYLADLMRGYVEAADRVQYCLKNGLPVKGMEIGLRMLKSLNSSRSGKMELFEKIFSDCFVHNMAVRRDDGSYQVRRTGMVVYIHPSSAFFKKRKKRIVFVDVFCTTKPYARVIGEYIGENIG